MSRWKPDARRRLQDAALALYAERGFADTTAAAVAERAGLTERTFFRYFADKRDVLFGNEDQLREVFVGAVAASPAALTPLAATAAGLRALAVELQPRQDDQLRRARIIAAHPELRERELAKLASWSSALRETLGERGVGADSAALAGEVALAVFRVAFRRWTTQGADAELDELVQAALDELVGFVGRPPVGAPVEPAPPPR
ncbi:MAG TPA: TetR family transcriptional regulator [Pseudonocardiaceae bacterium]|jgi:AcrR family transcriptional regulator|nr:TetR family transcriptional regulator [Pseudonocardiaceae bacterium]